MQQLHITTLQYGWITGAFLLMYPIGAPLTGYLMDRLGAACRVSDLRRRLVAHLYGARSRGRLKAIAMTAWPPFVGADPVSSRTGRG
jgi:MFS family permease